MSYDVRLIDPGTGHTLHDRMPHLMRGGTYQVPPTGQLSLNITYNYAPIFRRVIATWTQARRVGLWQLDGLSGEESIALLDRAIVQLGWDESDDYWEATEGNARRALIYLRTMAILRPDGQWEVR